MKPQLVLMMGAPGSGKTHLLRDVYQGIERLDVDEVQRSLGCDRPEAVRKAAEMQAQMLAERRSFVVDSTGRKPEIWVELAQEARRIGYLVVVVMAYAPLDVCIKRVAERGRYVPEQLIVDAWGSTRAGFHLVAEECDVAYWFNTWERS